MLLTRATLLLALLLAAFAPQAAQAQAKTQNKTKAVQSAPDQPPVIAIVDVQRIRGEALASASIRDQINATKERLEAGLKKDSEALKAQEEQLRRQQTILAPDAFAAKRRELEQAYADLRRRVQETSAKLAQAHDKAFNTLRVEMYKVLAEQMEEREISMTLARKNVLVYDERMNITNEVLKQLNARLPTVEVVFDADPK